MWGSVTLNAGHSAIANMLQSIRDLTSSWLALVVLGLFCVPFAFLGANFYFGESLNPPIAKVGDRELSSNAFRSATDRYRRERGAKELSTTIRDEALERMVDGGLVLEYAEKRRMQISDQQLSARIGKMFGADDFDLDEYQQFLRARRLSNAAFETQIRQDMLSRQLQDSIAGSVFLLDDELRRLARAELQNRDLAYIRINADEAELPEPDADAIARYYQEHPERYTNPEQLRISWLELTLAGVSEQLEVDEKELRNFYTGRESDYDLDEERRLSTLYIPISGDNPDREDALLLMDNLLERSAAGESLEALVGEEASGEDTGAAKDPVVQPPELDEDRVAALSERLELLEQAFAKRTGLPETQAEALFALETEGGLSAVLEDPDGLRILRLEEIRPGRVSTFENSREDAEQDYRAVEAERRFIEQAERLGNLAFESPGSLEPAATALGLEIQESQPFTLTNGVADEPSMESAVRDAAFSDRVLEARENSPLLEVDAERVMVLRLLERIPEALQPLAEVEEDIVTELEHQVMEQATREQGQALLGRLQEGEDREAVLADTTLEWVEQSAITRGDTEFLRAALREGFRMSTQIYPGYSGLQLGNGDYLLVALLAVQEIEDDSQIPAERLEELTQRLSGVRYQFEWREFLDRTREQHTVDIYQEQLERLWPDLKS